MFFQVPAAVPDDAGGRSAVTRLAEKSPGDRLQPNSDGLEADSDGLQPSA